MILTLSLISFQSLSHVWFLYLTLLQNRINPDLMVIVMPMHFVDELRYLICNIIFTECQLN